MKKWSLVALDLDGMHSVFALCDCEREEGQKLNQREKEKALLRILFAVVTPRLLQLTSSAASASVVASCD